MFVRRRHKVGSLASVGSEPFSRFFCRLCSAFSKKVRERNISTLQEIHNADFFKTPHFIFQDDVGPETVGLVFNVTMDSQNFNRRDQRLWEIAFILGKAFVEAKREMRYLSSHSISPEVDSFVFIGEVQRGRPKESKCVADAGDDLGFRMSEEVLNEWANHCFDRDTTPAAFKETCKSICSHEFIHRARIGASLDTKGFSTNETEIAPFLAEMVLGTKVMSFELARRIKREGSGSSPHYYGHTRATALLLNLIAVHHPELRIGNPRQLLDAVNLRPFIQMAPKAAREAIDICLTMPLNKLVEKAEHAYDMTDFKKVGRLLIPYLKEAPQGLVPYRKVRCLSD